jgi:hypothetical protein
VYLDTILTPWLRRSGDYITLSVTKGYLDKLSQICYLEKQALQPLEESYLRSGRLAILDS